MEKKRSKVGYIRRVSIILIIKVFCSAIRKHDLPHHAVSRRRDTESSWKTRPKGSDVVDLRSRKSRPSPRSSRRVPQRWGRAVHPVQERASACLAPSLVSDSFEHGGITNFSPLGAATAHDFNTQTSAKAVRTRFPPLSTPTPARLYSGNTMLITELLLLALATGAESSLGAWHHDVQQPYTSPSRIRVREVERVQGRRGTVFAGQARPSIPISW